MTDEHQHYRVEGNLDGKPKIEVIKAATGQAAQDKFIEKYPEVELTSVHAAWDWDF